MSVLSVSYRPQPLGCPPARELGPSPQHSPPTRRASWAPLLGVASGSALSRGVERGWAGGRDGTRPSPRRLQLRERSPVQVLRTASGGPGGWTHGQLARRRGLGFARRFTEPSYRCLFPGAERFAVWGAGFAAGLGVSAHSALRGFGKKRRRLLGSHCLGLPGQVCVASIASQHPVTG